MDIVYLSLGMPFDGDTPATASLGGSESAAYYKARELARRGHRVSMFTGCEKDGVFDGVRYCSAGEITPQTPLGQRFEHYARNTPHDVLIIQRHPGAFHKRFQAKVCIWETHDLALYRYAGQVNHGGWQVGAVTCVSEWHRQQTLKVYGFDPDRVKVVPNGVDLDLYESEEPQRPQGLNGKFLLLYQSRPERGLEHLVRPGGIMERLRTEAPDAHLLVAGYANTQAPMAAYYDRLREQGKACGNVSFLDPLNKPALARLQKACDLMVYPTEFEEVSPLRGDAVIDMPGGRETIETLWREGRKDFWVWSWSHAEKRMVIAKANKAIRTRQNTPMLTIRMKPKMGCKAKCETSLTLTPDHEVMLRDGTYKRACELQIGESLMPFGRAAGAGQYKRTDGTVSKYQYVSRRNLGDRVPEHRYVVEMTLGRKLKPREIVDHIDGNTTNNDPGNLQVWGSHAEHIKDHWGRLDAEEAICRKAERAASIHRYHATLSREEMRVVKSKAASARWDRQYVENHVVVAIEHANNADAYCMEVDDTHNFIANGIAVHNCMTAMEAMAAGLPMVTTPAGALSETCDGSGTVLLPLKDGKADEDAFVAELCRLIRVSPEKDVEEYVNSIGRLAAHQGNAARAKTWEKATDALESVIDELFIATATNRPAQIRHCIEHSDIMLAKDLATDAEGDIAALTRRELHDLYAFTLDHNKLETHYRKHQGKYYDEFEDRVIGEDVTSTARFQGVAMYLVREAQIRKDAKLKVLDYGCAHGHYLMPIAQYYKNWEFTGMDISARAISAATKWAARDGISNVKLVVGDQQAFTKHRTSIVGTRQYYDDSEMVEQVQDDGAVALVPALRTAEDLFDVIIAGEILEHVPDPIKLLNDFVSLLNPGGVIIATTPVGRWEWTGHEAFKTGREHLWHFERADIEEMCANVDVDISFAPANTDETGTMLGSWVWAARVEPGEKFVAYDKARKLKYLAPRQTIGAALIIKDGERTARKSLDSISGWVDQVVIAVDPATTDATREVIERWARDNPWTPLKVMDGLPAIEAGFDAARNRALEALETDWCLWFDADEEVQRPFSLWQFARPSLNSAFGLPQVHYSCDPPQVLTTDYPCRFFRRNAVKFYGVVHEHPEKEVGKAIPHATIRHEVQFLHSGYVDEGTRRKRFMRNLPLLHRDLEAYPNRGLNRFLWLRDIAQGIGFELEQTQGHVLEGQPERALKGIEIYEQMVEKDPPRMLVDALQYYSHCVSVTGGGFDVSVNMKLTKDVAPDLSVSLDFQGRFHTREFYFKFMRKLQEETTKYYEEQHL